LQLTANIKYKKSENQISHCENSMTERAYSLKKSKKVQIVRSVEKALIIINAFSEAKPEMSLSEICSVTGFPMPTVYRIINTLQNSGYISYSESKGTYRLGLKFFEVANQVARGTGLIQAASSALEKLSRKSGENASLSIFDGETALCLASFDSGDSLKASINVGERVPLHAGALSRTLLAFLPAAVQEKVINNPCLQIFTENTITDPEVLRETLYRIRELGYAYSESEAVPGISSVAAPIRDYKGDVVGAIAIMSPSQRMPTDCIDNFLEMLLECTAEISAKLGYRGNVNVAKTNSSDISNRQE